MSDEITKATTIDMHDCCSPDRVITPRGYTLTIGDVEFPMTPILDERGRILRWEGVAVAADGKTADTIIIGPNAP